MFQQQKQTAITSALVGSVDVISEWEERVAGQADVVQLLDPVFALLCGQQLRRLFERRIELLHTHLVADSAGRVHVDVVALLGTFDALLELHVDHARMLSDPPVVRFLAGQSGAVNSDLGRKLNLISMEIPS